MLSSQRSAISVGRCTRPQTLRPSMVAQRPSKSRSRVLIVRVQKADQSRRQQTTHAQGFLVDGQPTNASMDGVRYKRNNIVPSNVPLHSLDSVIPAKMYFPTKRAVCIGIAADSGCGKTTFVRRVASILSGNDAVCKRPKNIPDSNSLVSSMTTVLCLDDYHCLDRTGRKAAGVTALSPKAQNFDLMYEQVKALRKGIPIMKPIYNHTTGLLDPPEKIYPTQFLMIEGLHPYYDQRVADLLDFKVYLNVSDDVKFIWKMIRDMNERGHDADTVRKSIEARRPDFVNYVHPQIDDADIVIKVDLTPGTVTAKDLEDIIMLHGGRSDPAGTPLPLRVTMEQRLDGSVPFPPVQFMCGDDPMSSTEGPTCSIHVSQSMEMTDDMVTYLGAKPTGNPMVDRNLFALRMAAKACDLPGVHHQHERVSQFALSAYPAHRELCRPAVSLVMDGTLASTSELDALERSLIDSGLKYRGELSDLVIRTAFNLGLPGSKDATGLVQTLTAVKVREAAEAAVAAQAEESETEAEDESTV